jgi:hypothetical protein
MIRIVSFLTYRTKCALTVSMAQGRQLARVPEVPLYQLILLRHLPQVISELREPDGGDVSTLLLLLLLLSRFIVNALHLSIHRLLLLLLCLSPH